MMRVNSARPAAPSPWIAVGLATLLVALATAGMWFVVDRSAVNAASEDKKSATTASASPSGAWKSSASPRATGATTEASDAKTRAPEKGSAERATTNPGADYESACDLRGGSSGLPKAAPATEWVMIGNGWQLPVSKEHGPGDHDGAGAWTCFSRTPMGAVLAAYTISMRVDGLADDFADAVKRGTVADFGQQRALARGRTPAGSEPIVARGFSIDRYDPTSADVTLFLEIGGTPMNCSATVIWNQELADWQLQLRADGATQSCTMAAPETYVPWEPQGRTRGSSGSSALS